MSRPVMLWNSRQTTSITSDDAGTTIIKTILPPAPRPGPYESKSKPKSNSDSIPQTFYFVPSLAYFTLKILAEYPDELDLSPYRLYYEPPSSPFAYDILRALVPSYDPRPESESNFSLAEVDPRLWAVLVQVYNNLPDAFRVYPIPLSDKHLPVLQRIPSTSDFSLITVLDLGGCKQLTDETAVALKRLHGLCAFDASGTALSAYGVRVLSRTVESKGEMKERRGPWALRILRLTNCVAVDNSIYTCLPAFPLLSVVDLRGTKCVPNTSVPSIFRRGSNKSLYHPTLLTTSLSTLTASTTNMFSSPNLFILHISSLHHKANDPARSVPSVAMQDAYVVIPSINIKKEMGTASSVHRAGTERELIGKTSRTKILVGNSEALARRGDRMEELERHERNKEAWYERNAEAIQGHEMDILSDDETPETNGIFGSDTEATANCEDRGDDEDGMDSGEDGDVDVDVDVDGEDEDTTVDGTDDSEDPFGGENYDGYQGDEGHSLRVDAPTSLGENFTKSLLTAPLLASPAAPSCPPSRTWLVSETQAESVISNVNNTLVGSRFNLENASLPTPLTLAINNVQAQHTHINFQLNRFVAPSPLMAQSSTQPLALSSKSLHLTSRTEPASTSTSTIPRICGPVIHHKRLRADTLVEDGQIQSSYHEQADHPSGPIQITPDSLSCGALTHISRARSDAIRTESWKGTRSDDGGALADSNVDLPSTSRKRRKAGELPSWSTWKSVAPTHGAFPVPRRMHTEPTFAPDNPVAMSPGPRIADRNPSGRLRSALNSIKAIPAPPRQASGPSPIMRSTFPPATSSKSFEIDLQNSIAEQEAREVESRQAAAKFYRKSPTNPRPPSHPQMQGPRDYDEFLMLYRDPPPWSDLDVILEEPSLSIKMGDKRRATDVAILNRVAAKGTDGVEALAEMIKRRKHMGDSLRLSQGRGGMMNNAMPKVESKNPFRRKEEPISLQSATDFGTQKGVSTKSASLSERKFCGSGVGETFKSQPTVRPMKPTSLLQVPVLPDEFQVKETYQSPRQTPNEGATGLRSHNKDSESFPPTSSSSSGPSEQARAAQMPIKAFELNAVKKTQKGGKFSGTFNWKTWSKTQ